MKSLDSMIMTETWFSENVKERPNRAETVIVLFLCSHSSLKRVVFRRWLKVLFSAYLCFFLFHFTRITSETTGTFLTSSSSWAVCWTLLCRESR